MRTRRACFHAFFISVALCFAACGDDAGKKPAPAPSAAPAPEPKKPKPPKQITYREVPAPKDPLSCPECNVILISIDTLRADHLGTYGYERKTSPRIDGFARNALVFENAISQSSWTTPAHASMFTGLLPSEHGLTVFPQPGKLDPSKPTLASTLKDHGYATAAFVAGDFMRKAFGLNAGFAGYKPMGNSFEKTLPAARKWLGEHGDKPFFLFVHGSDPHRPYKHKELNTFHQPAQDYDIDNFCKHESRVREGDELEYVIAQYDAGIVYTDELIGKFLQYLDKQKLFRNSIVIITSDHGEELFDHGGCDHKHSVYRELTRVPLIVHLPSKLARGSSRRWPPRSACCRRSPRCSASTPPATPSATCAQRRSRTSRPCRSSARPATPIWPTPRSRRPASLAYYKRSVTTDAWTLIYNHTGEVDSYELYDIDDEAEKTDLAKQRTPVVKQLRKILFPPAGTPVLPTVDPTLTKLEKHKRKAARHDEAEGEDEAEDNATAPAPE